MTIQVASALVLALVVGACAGRSPAPVSVVQPMDDRMDCTAIVAEVQSNDAKISGLGREQGGKVAQNVIAGVAGIFIPILWLGMDFQNSAGKEVAALQQRQNYLAKMAGQRTCANAQPANTAAARVEAEGKR